MPVLGETRPTALKIFLLNERSLTRKEQLNSFNSVLQEHQDLGPAEKVPPPDLDKPPSETFYLSMRGVFKESSTTTKLRIVFDASAKTTTGVSLNDQGTIPVSPADHCT